MPERASMTSREARQPGITPILLVITAIFVTCLITANIIAVKLIVIFGHVLPAAIIIFPISYIIGDILTEVYGYRYARAIIWLGFLCNLIAVAAIWAAGLIPAASFWETQDSYDAILGYSPRLLVASFAAYLVGELANSSLLAKMKILTKGRWLWTRTIGSTIVGQGIDSMVFITIAFSGGDAPIVTLILTQWIAKVGYEIALTPLTYAIVSQLKRIEGIDHYDHDTNFSPIPYQ